MESAVQEEERLIDDGIRSRRSWEKGDAMDSPSVDENQELGFFKVWLLISQLLGVISIALVSAWCGQYLGGFAWQSEPKLQFNHHPFFMVLGLVFCYGNALLVYRVFRNQRKRSLKLLHFGLHTLAFIFAILAGTHHDHPLRFAVLLRLRGISLPRLDQDLADQVPSLARLFRPGHFRDGHRRLLNGHYGEDHVQRKYQIQGTPSFGCSGQLSWLLSLAIRSADRVLGGHSPVPKTTPARRGAAAVGSADSQQLMKAHFSAVDFFFPVALSLFIELRLDAVCLAERGHSLSLRVLKGGSL
ncbi:putative cytochrome b561 [Nephila pilipes]|uniref:Putative cytochrome b561 n=1 Tax=Nephila pilipes TaxID=299642 RepID=A0A8X6U9Y3_NEPPI|nr:putative cytochrome b561 [Nephila pilipes]